MKVTPIMPNSKRAGDSASAERKAVKSKVMDTNDDEEVYFDDSEDDKREITESSEESSGTDIDDENMDERTAAAAAPVQGVCCMHWNKMLSIDSCMNSCVHSSIGALINLCVQRKFLFIVIIILNLLFILQTLFICLRILPYNIHSSYIPSLSFSLSFFLSLYRTECGRLGYRQENGGT